MKPDFRLDGKVALVTGGSRGIGRAIGDALAEMGAHIVATSRDEAVALNLAAAYGTTACSMDVRDVESIRTAISTVIEAEGHIDLLVNNAGVNRPQSILNVNEESWDAVLDTNLKGAFFTAQAVARHMIERGEGGRIINIGSQAGAVGIEERASYCSSKGGLAQLTKVLAIELASHAITVNCVAPTFIETELSAATLARPEVRERFLGRVPLGRFGQPEDVTGAVIFLAGPMSGLVTGHTLFVDGGWTAW